MRNITKTAIPIAIMYILTYGEWEVMTFFASHMGPNEVAAWGMVGYVWETFEYIIGEYHMIICCPSLVCRNQSNQKVSLSL